MVEPGIEKTAPTTHLLAHGKKGKAQEAGECEQRTSLERKIHCPLPQSKTSGDKLQRATCTIKAKANPIPKDTRLCPSVCSAGTLISKTR